MNVPRTCRFSSLQKRVTHPCRPCNPYHPWSKTHFKPRVSQRGSASRNQMRFVFYHGGLGAGFARNPRRVAQSLRGRFGRVEFSSGSTKGAAPSAFAFTSPVFARAM